MYDPRKYKWFEYAGREAVFKTEKFEFSLKKGEKFGVKQHGGKHFVLDASDRSVQFSLKEADLERIIKNAKGYSGKLGIYKVEAGEGGRDRKRIKRDGLVEVRADSSMLREMWYDKANKRLIVTFPNNAVWQYDSVSEEEVKSLENSKSQGKFFNKFIKEEKHAERLENAP